MVASRVPEAQPVWRHLKMTITSSLASQQPSNAISPIDRVVDQMDAAQHCSPHNVQVTAHRSRRPTTESAQVLHAAATRSAQTVISVVRGSAVFASAPTTPTAMERTVARSLERRQPAFVKRDDPNPVLAGVPKVFLVHFTSFVATHRRFADVFIRNVITDEITSHTSC